MTERENYLAIMNGQQPEWVPNLQDAIDLFPPLITIAYMLTEEKRDYCGVKWTINDAGGMVDTKDRNYPIMDNAARWREFLNLPDLDTYDWKSAVEADLANHDPDKGLELYIGLGGGAFFMPLMNMMGFEEGLCAFLEDPDPIKEMFDEFWNFYEKLIPLLAKYYHPDTIVMGDDICTANGSFISFELYELLLRPYYKKCIDLVHSLGIKYEHHLCGKCELFIEDLARNLHIDSWQPAQGLNNLKGIKKLFGNKLVLNGTWSTGGPAGVPGAAEEIVRREVRECMDNLAVGGGMIFWNGDAVGSSQDQLQKMEWLADEARKYGKTFYKS